MMHHLAAHIEADNIKYNEKCKKTFECKLCQFKSTNQPDIMDHMIRYVENVLIPTGNETTATIEEDDLESENETDDAGDSDNLEYLCEGFDEYGNLI